MSLRAGLWQYPRVGPLEQEITELLQAPVASTQGSLYHAAGDTEHWWEALTREQRDELILLTFAGISDAIRRLARYIDESDGATVADGGD